MAGLNDGYDPARLREILLTAYGTTGSCEQGSDAWVQYDWDSEVTIYQSNAYYYTDGNFVPAEVWYEYKDANGEWRPLPNVQGCGTELNQYNVTTFDPVITTSIRMNMSPRTLGCGVIEWQVMGYADNVIDKTQLRRVIDSANNLDLSLFDASEEQLAELQAAIDEAQRISDSSDTTQEEVDAAAAKLANLILSLPTADGNLAYSASVATSFVSSWENLSAVNDGAIPENSYNPSMSRYGSWGNASAYETVTYTWNSEVTLNGADIYFWYDGTEGDYTSGGIQVPSEYYYEYLDSEGNWQPVENASAYDTAMDGYNNTTFDEVTTTAIRVTMMKQANDGNGVGIMEWKVYGTVAPIPEEKTNIAPLAAVSGICNYDGQDGRPYDQGGLPKMNDEIEPASSSDLSNGAWINWNDRYDADGNIQNAWVAYTWDEPMILDSTDVYYFTDNGGHQMPESVTFEYLNDDGEWVELTDVTPGCEADQYNTTELGSIRTTALRMTMEPQFLNDNDPACGVGVIEWKVYGTAAGGEEEPVVKDALNAAIEEAEKRVETDYTAESWANFARALENAKIVAADENADQTAVDEATALLNEAMGALVAAEPPADVDRTALEALIAEAEGYNRTDYTEESWAVFAEALTNAYSVDQNVEATQDDVDKAAEALQAAIDGLEEVHADVNLEEIRALIDEALQIQNDGYTAESWDALQNALVNAALAVSDPDVTQEQIDQLAAALVDAITGLKAAEPAEEVNLAAINALINVAQRLDKDNYTAESWNALQDALAAALAAAEDPEATQDQIDKAAAALGDAIVALEIAQPGEDPGEEPGENPNDKPGQTPDGNNGSGNGENGNSGSGADGEQNNEAAVQTGDNSPIMVYGVLVVIAAAGIICIIGMRKRRR